MKQNRISSSKIIKHLPIMLLFVFFLMIGWYIHRDYGLHWDSWSQYQIGKINYQYIFNGENQLLSHKDRYYGPFFELLLLFLTGSMAIRDMYFTQHFITYCFFILGLAGFYILIFRITRKPLLAIIGTIFIFLSPRIFADSFYNTKDIPFMSAFILSFLTLHFLYSRLNWTALIFHAVVTAMMIAIRLQGILIYALTFLAFISLFYKKDEKESRRKIITKFAVYLIVSFTLLILLFPALWHNPIREIFSGLQQLSRFPWTGGAVFYRGSFLDATALPWHYVPNWVLVTTPIIISAFFITGLIFLSIYFFRHPKVLFHEHFWIIMAFLWLTVPYLSVLILRSVLYDGWRHLFFIYPAYILIALFGIENLLSFNFKGLKTELHQIVLYGIILIGLVEPIRFVIQNHPFEYLYFNRFAGTNYQEIKNTYEMDYWGLAYFDALKDLSKLDKRPQIFVKLDNTPGKLNLMMLPEEDKERFIVKSDLDKSDYFLTNYRWRTEEYDLVLFHAIKINNASINSIYLAYRQNP